MSWLFSRALVAEYSAGTCSDGARSALLSASPTPQAFLPSDRMTAFSRPSRFGMTFAPLTDGLGVELLTWFLAAFRARTSRLPARAQESTANAPDCGGRWRELSVRYDRDSSSWRTHRSLWDEDLSACSLILPKWGSMRDGVLSELQMLERPTTANDAGLLPTPPASNTQAHHMRSGGRTARSCWPTPTVNDSKSCTLPLSQVKRKSIPGALLRDGEKAGGQLNPPWVEWLMGWPLGWTDLKPLETDRFRRVQQEHGGC
jgi:hypothetical protein